MRKGQRVETLTKTVGQSPRTGKVVDIRDEEFVEVEWDDGHLSVITRSALMTPSTSQGNDETSGRGNG